MKKGIKQFLVKTCIASSTLIGSSSAGNTDVMRAGYRVANIFSAEENMRRPDMRYEGDEGRISSGLADLPPVVLGCIIGLGSLSAILALFVAYRVVRILICKRFQCCCYRPLDEEAVSKSSSSSSSNSSDTLVGIPSIVVTQDETASKIDVRKLKANNVVKHIRRPRPIMIKKVCPRCSGNLKLRFASETNQTHFQCSKRRCKQVLENEDGNCFECSKCGRIFCLGCVLQNEAKLRRYGIGEEFGYVPLKNDPNAFHAHKAHIVANPMDNAVKPYQHHPQFLQPSQAAQIAPQLLRQSPTKMLSSYWNPNSLYVWKNVAGATAATVAENARNFVRRLSNVSQQ